MAANHLSPNLIVIMDCLWFQQAILFSEPLIPKPTTPPLPPQTLDLSSTSIPSPIEEESLSIASSSPTSLKDARDDDHDTEEERNDDNKIIKSPKSRQSLTKSKRRSHSSSGSPHKLPLSRRNTIDIPTSLRKCMNWVELEHEELKGFMDLGFTFKKEELNPRMMSVIPGLQRLGKFHEEDDEVEEFPRIVEESNVIRPYLSEAWLIKKPDSPLLNLRLPRVLGTDEMKKHLRYWARSVASAIQLEGE